MITHKMNLQLFAEPPAPTDPPTEPVPATEPPTEPTANPTPDPIPEQPKVVPEATFLELKRKYKEEQKLRLALQESNLEADFLNKKQEIKRELMATGEMSEAVAEVQAKFLAETYRNANNTSIRKTADEILLDELSDLANNQMFSDAPEYFEKVKEKKEAVKGLTTAEALQLVKSNFRESNRDFVQQQAVARRRGEEVATPNATPNPPASNPFKLSETEQKALAGLQKMFPDGEWTAEKMAKNRKQ
jgi:hypothetical protein